MDGRGRLIERQQVAILVARALAGAELVDGEHGVTLPNGSTLFPRYHCGARSTNMNRSRDKQDEDWRRVGKWLANDRSPTVTGGAST